jgi:hypothetical protein
VLEVAANAVPSLADWLYEAGNLIDEGMRVGVERHAGDFRLRRFAMVTAQSPSSPTNPYEFML